MELNIDVKVKILTTVAKSIYSDTLMKIREAVANSLDSKATHFIFTFKEIKEGEYSLSLYDNGNGITKNRFQTILNSIGYGLHLDDPDSKNYYSYFGLGLMSIFQIGKKLTIFTKPKDNNEYNKLEINSGQIFSKKMEKESITKLSSCFKLTDFSYNNRTDFSPLSEKEINNIIGSSPKHFTEIVIYDINKEDLDAIQSEDFIDKLMKILPLPIAEQDRFLDDLNKDDKEKLINLLNNKQYCPTISFFYSFNDDYKPLNKYFPHFKKPFRGKNYQFYSGTKGEFCYFLFAAGKDLGLHPESDNRKKIRESGLWFRNKNILVKYGDYLQHPGMSPLADQPIQNWLYGEFFHIGMEDFLQVSRNDFISNDKYKEFRKNVEEIVKPISDKLRESYNIGTEILKAIKDPIEKINTDKSPFKKIENSIKEIEGKGDIDVVLIDDEDITDILSCMESPKLEACNDLIDDIKSAEDAIEVVNKEKKYKYIIDPSATEDSIRYLIGNEYTEIVIPANIYESKEIVFFGKKFTVKFKNGKNIDEPISINLKQATIAINPFYPDIEKHSVSFIEVIVALNYSYYKISKKCSLDEYALDCLDKMRQIAIETLESNYGDFSEYTNPLGSKF